MADYDVIVVGGGAVGVAIAFGLARLGQNTAVFDEGDVAFRAARGNFGLIWVQGKGDNCTEYANWTRLSADRWNDFDREIRTLSHIDTGYRRPGGMHLCLSTQELDQQEYLMARMARASDDAFKYQMLDRNALVKRIPTIGPKVVGASFCPLDGHVNPLRLLHALHIAFKAKKGTLHIGKVLNLSCTNSIFKVSTATHAWSAKKVVLAAGLGNKSLATELGLSVPVHPQRGQILVTERLKPFLNYPTSLVRQTVEGSVLLGDSHEEVGLNDRTSSHVMQDIADRARCLFPFLERARILRAWGALRILSADGLPIYDQSEKYPGAFSASTHSGITFAAAHGLEFASFVAHGEIPSLLNRFSERRFHAD